MKFKDFLEPYLESLPQRRPVIFHDQAPLTIARGRLFDAVRTRALKLKTANVPSSYFVGQEYVEGAIKVDVIICALVNFPAYIESFRFFHNGIDVRVVQRDGFLQLELRLRIANSLWDDIRIYDRGEQFIIGYFYSILPKVNKKIIDIKYRTGQLLARNFSVFELQRVGLICRGRMLMISWPTAFLPYEPSAQLATEITDVYMRDYVDAFGAYFRNDYDECIRKIITSAESFIAERSWRPRKEKFLHRVRRVLSREKRPAGFSFRRALADNLRGDTVSGAAINANMQEIYTIRNKIVHDGFHMSTNSAMYCSKSLGTLHYLINRYSGSNVKSHFSYTLHMQFNMQCGMTGENFDLHEIGKMRLHSGKEAAEMPTINSHEKLEQFPRRLTREG